MNFSLEKVIFPPCSHRKSEEEEAVGATYCERLDDLLQRSDFVMLAMSLTPQTQRLIGRRELRLMKPTAILVNIGRGTSLLSVWLGNHAGGKPQAGLSAFLVNLFPGWLKTHLDWWGGELLFRNISDFCLHIFLNLKLVFFLKNENTAVWEFPNPSSGIYLGWGHHSLIF